MKSLLLLALGLARTVVLGARIEAERIVVSVRPYKREQRRCPVCGRACDFYDMANRGAPRLWRAMDLARSACYLEYAPCRVRCPEHGVRTEAVPWARHGARFTRDFEDWVAWLAVRCTASAVSELARVEWHSVGGVCRRVYAELEAARGASRFDGVRRIGIDETSYKKGHKYVTVVVDHDRGCLIWAHEGTGKDVLNLFLDELTREQRRAILPPDCRNVPITVDGRTVTAYVQINHFAMMLQDGLLMEEHFFDVCSHFQRAGYHVVWLMRCTQDIENGYLKLKKQRGDKCLWKWRKPTTNFGRWTSDNRCVTILLQYKRAPDGPLENCTDEILQRVQWAESSDDAEMVPSRTEFATVGVPGSPADLARWLRGGFMSGDL